MREKHVNTKDLTKISIMAALVFAATYLIKVPSLNGYTHIGDSMVIISAIILGKKKGALAAGLGAALCDLLSGYMQYIVPTFLIKALLVLITVSIAEKLIAKTKFAWVIGAIIGCIFQVFAYALVETFMYGFAGAMASVVGNIIQSTVGLVISMILVTVLEKSNILKKLKSA